MNRDLSNIRRDYAQDTLTEDKLKKSPFEQFKQWFDEALAADFHDPSAMVLSTVNSHGRPSARIVLLKSYDDQGFCFFTNYDSRKGSDLAANPFAALTFWWDKLERQVRIEGKVEKMSAEESDAYFNQRPLGSRIGACASPQSRVIPSAEYLQDKVTATEATCDETGPARPENWGGYRLKADYFEFWQGRPSRLHDRLTFEADSQGNWHSLRLAP